MKVLVAMSGGVDSSIAAALLQKQHETTGVMLRLFDEQKYGVARPEGGRACCSITDIEDARLAARRLGIPFHVFNFSDMFSEQVIDRFAAAYAQGHTPNPCLDCNRYIKFSALLRQAKAMGFDAIATGHYAQVCFDEASGRWLLKKAADESKDQSYVLYTLTQDELAHLQLPLGGLHKTEVRALAGEIGLVNADKPDSQDICFVPDGDYAGFLQRECGLTHQEGDFVDTDGTILGRHKGIAHYTVGQRRGLGLGGGARLYVVDIDAENNRVVLGGAGELVTKRFSAEDMNWIALNAPKEPFRAMVRTRYHQPESPATVYPQTDDSVLVEYDAQQKTPAPGQAAVFYNGDTVLGGGTITKGRV